MTTTSSTTPANNSRGETGRAGRSRRPQLSPAQGDAADAAR